MCRLSGTRGSSGWEALTFCSGLEGDWVLERERRWCSVASLAITEKEAKYDRGRHDKERGRETVGSVKR